MNLTGNVWGPRRAAPAAAVAAAAPVRVSVAASPAPARTVVYGSASAAAPAARVGGGGTSFWSWLFSGSGGSSTYDIQRAMEAGRASMRDMTPYRARPIDVSAGLRQVTATQDAALRAIAGGRRTYTPLFDMAALQLQQAPIDWGTTGGAKGGGLLGKLAIAAVAIGGVIYAKRRWSGGRSSGSPPWARKA